MCTGSNEFVDGKDGVNCLKTCSDFIFSFEVNNLKICKDFVKPCSDSSDKLELIESNKTLICSGNVCLGKNIIGSYCVESCKQYFLNPAGCNGVFSSSNGCQMPIEENGICIIPVETNISNGNSGKFGPCHVYGNYLNDYSCVPCNGPS
jgi:hypothetical protein